MSDINILEDNEEWDELDELFTEYQPLDLQVDSFGSGSQWILFKLDSEIYGIEIRKVQELTGYTEIAELPNMPDFFKGMLNLRGQVIPIIDLRMKFGIEEREYNKYTVIIVVKIDDKLMGLGVDELLDVIAIAPESIQPVDEFSASINTDYIRGMGHVKEELAILLDIDYVLSKEEFGIVSRGPEEASLRNSEEQQENTEEE